MPTNEKSTLVVTTSTSAIVEHDFLRLERLCLTTNHPMRAFFDTALFSASSKSFSRGPSTQSKLDDLKDIRHEIENRFSNVQGFLKNIDPDNPLLILVMDVPGIVGAVEVHSLDVDDAPPNGSVKRTFSITGAMELVNAVD